MNISCNAFLAQSKFARFSYFAFFVLLMLCHIPQASAQTTYGRIVGFDFSNTSGFLNSKGSSFNNATYVDTSLVVKSGTLSSPLNSTVNGNFIVNNYFIASGFTANSEALAITMNSFVQFTITPKAGYEFRLDSLLLRWRNATSGVTAVFVRTSQNNFATTVAADTVTRGSAGLLRLGLTSPITSDSNIVVRIYAYGSAASQNFGFGERPISTINPDIEARGRMSAKTPISNLMAGVGTYNICQGSPVWLKHIATDGTPPYTIYFRDAGNHRYQTVLNKETDSVQIYPEGNWNYTLDSVIDVNGHKATSLLGNVNVNVQAGSSMQNVGTWSYSHPMTDASFRTFADGASCGAWMKISDTSDGIALGTVNAGLQTYANLLFNQTSRYFVPRKFSISASQPATATVTFYLTQADFNAFNAQTSYQLKMPIDSSDVLNNRSNIRVVQSIGNNESNELNWIQPESITWNSSQQYWEVVCRVVDSVMNGNYYITSHFTSSKMVGAISHTAQTPQTGNANAVVTIDWADVPGVTQYRFRFRPKGTLSWNVSTITGSERTYSYLSFNTTYELQVRVYENATTQGEYSGIYEFTTPIAPNKSPDCISPTASVLSVTATSVNIQWVSVAYAETYQVQMRPKNSLNWGGTSTASTSWSFNSLSPSTTYEYRIRTQCAAGQTAQDFSAFNAIDTFRTADAVYCETPLNIALQSVNSNSAVLVWDNSLYAQQYTIQSRVKNTLVWGGTTVVDNSVMLDELSPNTTYEFRVRSVCDGSPTQNSNSVFSASFEFTTAPQELGVCLAPQINNISSGTNSISISWDNVANGALYFVQFKPQSASTWGGSSTTGNQLSWSNLSANTAYDVRIRTTCNAGTTLTPTSMFSSIQTISTNAAKAAMPQRISVYPNPTDNWIHITRSNTQAEQIEVRLVDLSGRILANTPIELSEGQTVWTYSLANYVPGFYFLHINDGQGGAQVLKIQRK
ncbi:MAG: fibronectin type III domain-containing protein [Chitinophagaceae bacterium]